MIFLLVKWMTMVQYSLHNALVKYSTYTLECVLGIHTMTDNMDSPTSIICGVGCGPFCHSLCGFPTYILCMLVKILLRIIKQFLLICFSILYLYSLCNVDVEYFQQSISYLRELLSFFPADMTDQTKRAFGTGIFCG